MFAASLAVLALSALRQTPSAQGAPNVQPRAEFLNWAGFKYLPAANRHPSVYFPVPTDLAAGLPDQAKSPDATPWRLRIFVIQRMDSVTKLPDGTLYEENSTLDQTDVDRIKRSVATLAKLVAAKSGGKLILAPQISLDAEPIGLGGRTVEEAVKSYVYPRANGGKYESEDHVPRGPYESIVCLHPMPTADKSLGIVNGMPTSALSVYGFPGFETEGGLTQQLGECLAQAMKARSRWSGLLSWPNTIDMDSAIRSAPEGNWPALVVGADLSAAEIDSRLKLKLPDQQPTNQPIPSPSMGYIGATSEVKIEPDADKGQMMAYIEKGNARNGGLCLPFAEGAEGQIDVSKTPTMDIWVRSTAKEPLQIQFSSPTGTSSGVSLGADLPGPSDIRRISFDRDGTWHQVKIDLKTTGLTSISQVRLLPTPNSLLHPKATLGSIEYDFASFEATSDHADPDLSSPEPSPDSPDAWARARWAHTAKPSAKLLALLKDPEWFVELNATQAYIAQPDPGAEAVLTQNASLSIDGPVAAASCRALWALGTTTAKAEIHQIIQTGSTEQAKGECARILGETKDTNFAPELIILQQSRRLDTRLAAIDALGQMTGENAAIIRMSFIYQDDPQQKLEVTRTSVAQDAYQWKKLLWSSVNETSDAVRLESDEKLLGTSDPAAHAGGTAGVKDDSLQVRIQLLDYMAAHPDETNRDAIRLAVIDRSASVKAAAVRAFDTLPKGVKPEELGGVLTDAHPVVQLAVLQLAKDKKVTLSEETLKLLEASADPDVQIALKALNS